ncbi:aspartate transaminase [Lujinxingia litoralis]|uniref:Aminotransferase n=1 Tax=Lujinxingia litoralis TaxID=2211119 RepID=A0A328CA35_9DELT|nr:aspartate transaminase [Lujinxingia litoralis]
MKLSHRIGQVEPSPTLAITARAKELKAQGIDIISFGAGEPDFDTPQPVVDAAIRALKEGKTRYTAASGLPELRQAIAQRYKSRGREVAANQVIVTVGGKQALYNATQAIFNEGDRVLIPAPYWVSYPAQLRLAGAEPVILSTRSEEDFKLTAAALRAALEQAPTRGLILCSPSNPTGATYTADELRALATVLRDFPEVVVFYDAMYDELYYQGALAPDLVASAPELEGRVITFNGFSKTFAMTGWRLGYAIGPAEVIAALGTLQSQSTSNATSFAQYGALACFELDDSLLAERRQAFMKRRDLIVGLLREIPGVICPEPTGAFYAFADFSAYIGDAPGQFKSDVALSEFLLEEARVAVVPGSAFGHPGGLRLSYATGESLIQEGLRRIQQALNDRPD